EVGGARARVPHHPLEQRHAVGAGHEGPEDVALVEGDVGARRAVDATARHLAVQHEHDVVAVVTVGLDDHPRVPPRIKGEEAGREVEPLLAYRRGPLAVLLPADRLPGEVIEVSDPWAAGHEAPLIPGRTRARLATAGGLPAFIVAS